MRIRRTTRMALAALLAAVLLAACGGATDSTNGPDDPSAQDPTDQPAGDQPADDQTDEPADDEPTDDAGAEEPFEVQPEGQELVLRRADGEVEILATLNPEGEAFFRAARVQPGGTVDDFTVLLLVQAEGMFDLRYLVVTDGEAGEVTYLPDEYQMAPSLYEALSESEAPLPAWSPDGRSIAWIEWSDGDVTLRTVGWEDGPGTGRTADDNAAFGLEGVSEGVWIESWTGDDDGEMQIHLVDGDSAAWDVTIVRQSDGALALEADAVQPAS